MRTVKSLFIAMLSVAATGAFAATYVVPSDDVLVGKADGVVVARVMSTWVEESNDGAIETVTQFSVEENVKGSVPYSFRTRIAGGATATHMKIVGGAPRFVAGDRALLFLTKRDDRDYMTTDFGLGQFGFGVDQNGHAVAMRADGEIGGIDLSTKALHVERRRDAQKFLNYLRAVANNRRADVDYYVDSSRPLKVESESLNLTAHPIAPLATGTPTSYTLIGTGEDENTTIGSRWRTFGSGINWNQGNSETGAAPSGGTTAITSALAAWNNDCPSAINYVLASSNANSNGILDAADGVNNVVFEKNLGAGTFSCASGGVLGLGGVQLAYTGNCTAGQNPNTCANTLNGVNFGSTSEADVSMNIGVGACIGNSLTVSDFNSAVTHELGHTLGLRHADKTRNNSAACTTIAAYDCATSAIMTAFVSSGLNGQLAAWDQRAIGALYPGGSCSSTVKPQDFDGDGKSDVVVRNSTSGNIALWLMNGPTITKGLVIGNPGLNYSVVTSGDYNGDGKADIALQATNGDVAVWLMNGNVVTAGALISTPGVDWKPITSGDFNGDGKADILLQNQSTGDVAVWLMNGFTVTGAAIATPGLTWQIKLVGDFNGDGKSDILLQNSATGEVAEWQMNGFAVTSGAVISSPGTLWKVKAAGDYNADGKTDIILRNQNTGEVAEWLMNGFAITSGVVISSPGLAYDVLGSADYNGDGKSDLLLQNQNNGDIAQWLLNGQSIASGALISTPGTAWKPVVH